MTPEQLNKWSIDHGHPRKISPGRRFADELRLGESGNRWLQAQCALGTGEARRRRVRHLQRCHCSDNGKGLNRQRRRVANLACNTGLAMRRVRWGRVAGAGVAGAIGNCRFGARRVGMHRRRCPRFMGMRNRRHRHLHRHCVPHPAAQRQHGDHQSEQYMAHGWMIAAMKESSLQWVIRRCTRDAMPPLHQLWPVRGEGCQSPLWVSEVIEQSENEWHVYTVRNSLDANHRQTATGFASCNRRSPGVGFVFTRGASPACCPCQSESVLPTPLQCATARAGPERMGVFRASLVGQKLALAW